MYCARCFKYACMYKGQRTWRLCADEINRSMYVVGGQTSGRLDRTRREYCKFPLRSTTPVDNSRRTLISEMLTKNVKYRAHGPRGPWVPPKKKEFQEAPLLGTFFANITTVASSAIFPPPLPMAVTPLLPPLAPPAIVFIVETRIVLITTVSTVVISTGVIYPGVARVPVTMRVRESRIVVTRPDGVRATSGVDDTFEERQSIGILNVEWVQLRGTCSCHAPHADLWAPRNTSQSPSHQFEAKYVWDHGSRAAVSLFADRIFDSKLRCSMHKGPFPAGRMSHHRSVLEVCTFRFDDGSCGSKEYE